MFLKIGITIAVILLLGGTAGWLGGIFGGSSTGGHGWKPTGPAQCATKPNSHQIDTRRLS